MRVRQVWIRCPQGHLSPARGMFRSRNGCPGCNRKSRWYYVADFVVLGLIIFWARGGL